MAKIENFGKALNFPVAFNRSGPFPLDADILFSDYDSALEAAVSAVEVGQSGDSNYYYGQLLIVTEGDNFGLYQIKKGTPNTLVRFGQASSADELLEKFNTLNGKVTTLETTVGEHSSKLTELEGEIDSNTNNIATLTPKVTTAESDIKTLKSDVTANKSRLAEITDEDYKNKISSIKIDGTALDIVDGVVNIETESIDSELENIKSDIENIRANKNNAKVYKNKEDANYIADLKKKDVFKVGDNIYFTDENIVDQWVSAVLETADASGYYYTLTDLETAKVDLTDYATKSYVDTKVKETDDKIQPIKDDISSNYVKKTTTIAGVNLRDNITSAELATAIKDDLGLDAAARNAISIDLDSGNITPDTLTGKINLIGKVLEPIDGETGVTFVYANDDQTEKVLKAVATPDATLVKGLVLSTNGKVKTLTPVADDDAANKKYVDDAIANAKTEYDATSQSVADIISGTQAVGKVAHTLSIDGQTFDGSANVSVDLPAIVKANVPLATAEQIGGFKLGHADSTTEAGVKLDDEGKAYVTIPEAVKYAAGDGLTLSDNSFSIADGGVKDKMISEVGVTKLYVEDGVDFVLDGGHAE